MLRSEFREDVFLDLLDQVNIMSRDNGKKFTDTGRLDVIRDLLWDTPYRRVNAQGLFHLYAKKPLHLIEGKMILVSSHVDCQVGITRCSWKVKDSEYLRGTFDNSITNTVMLYLMRQGALPENVAVAFTGDEEEDSHGARQAVKYMQAQGKLFGVMVLDVTDMGFSEKLHISVENDFWTEGVGRQVIALMEKLEAEDQIRWHYVPSDPAGVPSFVPGEKNLGEEAEADESWAYDEKGIPCFSLCIPVEGNMHRNAGVLVSRESLRGYTCALERLLRAVHAGGSIEPPEGGDLS
jgi:hypothetical protein